MADAEQQENLPNDQQQQADKSKGKDVLAERLAEITEMLRVQNEQTQAQFAALSKQSKSQEEEETEDNLYVPEKLLAKADERFDKRLKEERAKDAVIYEMGQEYPEIKSDTQLRAAILTAQKALPESVRDTAAGYEMAVLKAVAKAGLTPKSKRQTASDEDVSMSPRSSGDNRPKGGKVKVSQNTLAVAQLMGRDISDPEVLKRLEAAAQRTNYKRWE